MSTVEKLGACDRPIGQNASGRWVTSGLAPRAQEEGERPGQSQRLLGDRAYDLLVANLREGKLAAGQFVSMPRLVDLLGMPLGPIREAVKRAEARSLLCILPKRGVVIMTATPKDARDCLDLRAILEVEGARRLIESSLQPAFGPLEAEHLEVLEAGREDPHPDLPKRAIDLGWTLHDRLTAALGNPIAEELGQVNRVRFAVIQNSRPLPPARVASAMEEQLAIMDAIERRDFGHTATAIRTHCRATLRWWGVLS